MIVILIYKSRFKTNIITKYKNNNDNYYYKLKMLLNVIKMLI